MNDNEEIPVEPLKDSDPMPFGKFRGEKIGDVPAWYLIWLLTADFADIKKQYPRLYAYIEKNEAYLEKEKAKGGR